jgi:hypothetical protein
MTEDVEPLYLQHLTDADRRLLRQVAGSDGRLLVALSDPRVEAVLFDEDSSERGLAETSTFLTFAVAVHRTGVWLNTAHYVEERWAARQRIPIFDVESLRALLAEDGVRFFLIELLASYTRVSSGLTWERTGRGWRRRRFSELDPVRLAGLLEVTEPAERAGIYRRLGDLALFLTGVFTDRSSAADLGGAALGRLLRLSGVPPTAVDDLGDRQLLELLGARWYRLAVASAKGQAGTATREITVVEKMSARFVDARRILNIVTDRYLYPLRERWFGVAS